MLPAPRVCCSLRILPKAYRPVFLFSGQNYLSIMLSSSTPTLIPKTQCLKVQALRQTYGRTMDLQQWMAQQDHLYVGRQGRIFITDPETKAKRIFHYKASKWANPYKVGLKAGEYSLADSLRLYRAYVMQGPLHHGLHELAGLTLGCFCDQAVGCHTQVLAALFREVICSEPSISPPPPKPQPSSLLHPAMGAGEPPRTRSPPQPATGSGKPLRKRQKTEVSYSRQHMESSTAS